MKASARRVLEVIADGGRHFLAHHGFVYSAAIAFNILLASIPVLFLVFAATSLVIGRNELPFSMLTTILKETFPYGSQVLVPNLRKLFASGTTFGVVGTLLLMATSFSATDAVHTSLAVMLGARREKKFWRSAGFHVAVVLVLIVLSSAAILVPPIWKGIAVLMKGLPGRWDHAFNALIEGFFDVLLAVVIFAASVLSYRYLSPKRISLENALAGSLTFLLMLYAIKGGFTFYVKKFSRLNVIYGSLFSTVCFIIGAYLFAAAYLFCASIIGILEKGVTENGAAGGD